MADRDRYRSRVNRRKRTLGAWSAPTTTDKDRKLLLRSLLDEVNISVHRDQTNAHAELVLRWKGGAIPSR